MLDTLDSTFKPVSVSLKAAVTLDGKIATSCGDSQWITGKEARARVHQLRHEHDAILVGINTVLADNPRLTAWEISNVRSPIRVVLDSQARLPDDCQILNADGVPVIAVIGSDAPERSWPQREGLSIVKSPTRIPEIPWILDQLGKHGIGSLLVEGGSLVHASFIQCGFVDRLYLFIAPKVIGGQDAISWCGELGHKQIADASRWQVQSFDAIGEDLLIFAYPKNLP